MKDPNFDFEGSTADYHLMEGLLRQEPEALVALHTRYATALRLWVMRIVYDATDADDVVQDVFVQLWTRPERYCPAKGKPFSWLLTLSRRRAIDCLRRRDAYRRATERFELAHRRCPQAAIREQQVAKSVSQRDLRLYLLQLMAQLPPAQRIVLEYGFFKNMSQRQIAAAMHLPLGTVKTRMELGLKKLAHAAAPLRAQIE